MTSIFTHVGVTPNVTLPPLVITANQSWMKSSSHLSFIEGDGDNKYFWCVCLSRWSSSQKPSLGKVTYLKRSRALGQLVFILESWWMKKQSRCRYLTDFCGTGAPPHRFVTAAFRWFQIRPILHSTNQLSMAASADLVRWRLCNYREPIGLMPYWVRSSTDRPR